LNSPWQIHQSETSSVTTAVRDLWAGTVLLVWESPYVVVDLPAEETASALRVVASRPEPFVNLLIEPDQVSLTIRQSEWQSSDLMDRARDAAGPFRVVTLKQDVGLDVFGFLAPPVARLAAAGIPIIPHGAYLKEHWVFLEADFERALGVISRYIEEVAGRPPVVEQAP
jgi:hypothetical protein